MLALYEEIALLTLDPVSRKFPRSNPAGSYILITAVLSELMIRNRIRREQDGILTVTDTASTGVYILDIALKRMTASKRKRETKMWVLALMQTARFFDLVIASLVQKGIIQQQRETRFLFPVTRYVLINPAVVESLKHRIRITEDAARNERIAAFIGLVISGESALKHLFAAEEWKETKERFRSFAADSAVSQSVKEVLKLSGGGEEVAMMIL